MRRSHCCFAGCDLRSCGCCRRMTFHESTCSENPLNQLAEIRAGIERRKGNVTDTINIVGQRIRTDDGCPGIVKDTDGGSMALVYFGTADGHPYERWCGITTLLLDTDAPVAGDLVDS